MRKITPTMIAMFLVVLFHGSNTCYGQEPTAEDPSPGSPALTIYVDCDGCDLNYYIKELTFVKFVRDRKQADVHVLVTDQSTGGGGDEITLTFLGQGRYAGRADTLKCHTIDSDTDDMERQKVANVIKMGLVRYLARTPLAEYVTIGFSQPSEEIKAADRWNSWVFEVEANCWLNGQKAYRALSVWGDASASRITENAKTSFDLWGNYSEDRYLLEDGTEWVRSRGKGVGASQVIGLGDHWSGQVGAQLSSSEYSNKRSQTYSSAAVEFNLFPYHESTRRQLRFGYMVAVRYVDYFEETIFDKTNEWLASQQGSLTLDLVQPWGSIRTSLSASHYLHNISRNRMWIDGSLSLRLLEGLSFRIDGRYSRFHDQLSLRKGDDSDVDVLLRRYELATSYDYYMSVGISYTFGSIYNEVVNARFGN